MVASGINWANGIVLSKDETHVFVASSTQGMVQIYERTLSDGLRHVDQIKVVTYFSFIFEYE